MDKIKPFIFIAILAGFCSCRQTQRNSEPKYQQHHSYKEFLEFLKHKTDTIDSDYDKTTYIRIKVAELIDRVFLNEKRDAKYIDRNWASWNGERYYNVFFYDSATVICGGSANFLNNIYNDLGYSTTTYDMGIEGVYTHQTTLVRPSSNADYYVQDAFHNIRFEDAKSNQPLAFKNLINYLISRNDSIVHLVRDTFEYKPTLDTIGLETLREKYLNYRDLIDSIIEMNNYDKANLTLKNKQIYERYFFPKGYPENSLYLYLFPLKHNS